MDVDIIVEADTNPQQLTELAVAAEKLGIRALWSTNYHQYWDAFVSIVPAAMATSKIILGPLAVSPWEMHPLKMANAILTVNEIAGGRAMLAVGGGGGVLGAIGWKTSNDATMWPYRDSIKGTRFPDRRVRAIRECLEILIHARSGKMTPGYDGGVFQIPRPFAMQWAKADGPLLYGCCNGPQMIKLGARLADGIQFSDFTVDMLSEGIATIQAGLETRATPAGDFRIGNFWAWHIKKDIEASMYEARRELIWRGAVIGREPSLLMPFLHDEDELQIVLDNFDNFRKAHWTRTGQIDGVPEDIVQRLIAGLSSAGDLGGLDAEIERFRQFRDAGLTELSLRLHDDPMDALKLIAEHVLPAVQ